MILLPIICVGFALIYYNTTYNNDLFYSLQETYEIKYKKYKQINLTINLSEEEKKIFSIFNKNEGPTLRVVGGWTRGKVIFLFSLIVNK
jgi:3-isopropylmalate dehydratase small subunit